MATALSVHVSFTRAGRALLWAARRIEAATDRDAAWAAPAAAVVLVLAHLLPLVHAAPARS